jgi:hypothetical protein
MLRDEWLFQRATQVYLWALPILHPMGMKEGSEKVFGAGYHVLPVWKKRLDPKTVVTTPNSEVIYALSYLNVGKDGPLVVEVPAGGFVYRSRNNIFLFWRSSGAACWPRWASSRANRSIPEGHGSKGHDGPEGQLGGDLCAS